MQNQSKMPCPFCSILEKRDEPILYEDEDLFVILTHKPITTGHALVIPKQHIDRLIDLPDALADKVMRKTRELAPKIYAGVGTTGGMISVNVGEISHRSVAHCHVHIIPRFEDDGLKGWDGPFWPVEKREELVEQLRKRL